ncbi:MAG: MucB/RseB C-terminal domain-containing protein [Dokdonella sp.]
MLARTRNEVGVIFGVILALTSTLSLAQVPDGAAMLAQMASAMRSLDYQGSFAYQHAGRIDTMRVFHAGGARERERLISLNGPRSEVIRNGTQITCIQADDSAIVYQSPSGRGLLPLVPDAADPALREHYQITMGGNERVAGYDADIVDIVPLDAYRYGYRMWIEKATRLLLRSVVTDSKRRPLEQFMFVSLEIGNPPDDTDLVPRQRELLTTTAAQGDEIDLRGEVAWKAANAPPGFTLRSARRSREGAPGAQHLVYSDGLANVSIYVEPRSGRSDEMTTLAGRGTLNIASYSTDKWQFTVLGDVPLATVTAISQSLIPLVAP